MSEIWKDIEGFEGLYRVSNLGAVKSLPRKVNSKNGSKALRPERIMKPDMSEGYFGIHLQKNGTSLHTRIHRLIAIAFIPNPENKPQINHINGIKTDNRIGNLEWCTASENQQHSFRVLKTKNHMQGKLGALSPRSKAIICIETGKHYGGVREAARDLNLFHQHISGVLRNKQKTSKGLTFKYA